MQEKREAFSSFYEIYTMCNKSVISNQVIDIPPHPPKKWAKWGRTPLRDWSLITGRGGGATKREGVQVKFYPYEKGGGGGKSFSHAEGGSQKVLG